MVGLVRKKLGQEKPVLRIDELRDRHRVLQAVEQVRRRVRVRLTEVGQQLVVLPDLRHLRVDVGQDLVAVNDRLTEPVTESVERFRGGRQCLIQLDRVDL